MIRREFTHCAVEGDRIIASGRPWWHYGDAHDVMREPFLLSVNGLDVEMVMIAVNEPGGWTAQDVASFRRRHLVQAEGEG